MHFTMNETVFDFRKSLIECVQVKKNPKLRDKKVEVLIKPVKLEQVENTILNLVNK